MAALLTRHWKLAILWALSLLAVGAISSSAQAQRLGLGSLFITESPTVVSGNDVGFRIERARDGILIGRLVVRVDGRWVDTGVPAR
jgi:hypothetical protein